MVTCFFSFLIMDSISQQLFSNMKNVAVCPTKGGIKCQQFQSERTV